MNREIKTIVFTGKNANRIYRYATIGKMTVVAGIVYGIYKLSEIYEENRIFKIFNENC